MPSTISELSSEDIEYLSEFYPELPTLVVFCKQLGVDFVIKDGGLEKK